MRAHFPGIHIKIIERKGNPCSQPELQRHFRVGYKIVQIDVTESHEFMRPGHWHYKLVNVKQSWNVKLREQCRNQLFSVIEPDEVVLGIGVGQDMINGMDVEIIMLILYGLSTGVVNYLPIYLPHRTIPLLTHKVK